MIYKINHTGKNLFETLVYHTVEKLIKHKIIHPGEKLSNEISYIRNSSKLNTSYNVSTIPHWRKMKEK